MNTYILDDRKENEVSLKDNIYEIYKMEFVLHTFNIQYPIFIIQLLICDRQPNPISSYALTLTVFYFEYKLAYPGL